MPSSKRHIFIVGYPGAGKTSVGERLAQRIGWPLYDTDRYIEEQQAMAIGEIFKCEGEAKFREYESAAIKEIKTLCRAQNAIIVTGGGAVICEENRREIKDGGTVVFLYADIATLTERTRNDSPNHRPLLNDDNLNDDRHASALAHLIRERTPLYEAVADCKVDTGALTIDEAVNRVLHVLKPVAGIEICDDENAKR